MGLGQRDKRLAIAALYARVSRGWHQGESRRWKGGLARKGWLKRHEDWGKQVWGAAACGGEQGALRGC